METLINEKPHATQTRRQSKLIRLQKKWDIEGSAEAEKTS